VVVLGASWEAGASFSACASPPRCSPCSELEIGAAGSLPSSSEPSSSEISARTAELLSAVAWASGPVSESRSLQMMARTGGEAGDAMHAGKPDEGALGWRW
jgi:hypothetical protein